MNSFLRFFVAAIFGTGIITSAFAGEMDDAAAIRHLVMQTFDKPDARLTVDPITVDNDIAIVGWAQGDMGGRALLRKKEGGWTLFLCSGDALTKAASLQQFGLAADRAQVLSSAVILAESKLDPVLVGKFSRFDGLVMMDEQGEHPSTENPKHHHN